MKNVAEHRRLYPQQYRHELVGKTVQTEQGKTLTITRVVTSRFGPLAIDDAQDSTVAYMVRKLTVVKK